MYRCDECKLIFENPRKYTDDTGETIYVCPDCLGDYEEVHKCECGKIIEIDENMCQMCKTNTIIKFKKDLKKYTKDELKWINEYFDGEEIK